MDWNACMSCWTLIPKDGFSCESNLEKKMETERMSENVRVKVSSIRPGVYPTVMRSQQREEAHVSVCLVAGATGSLSLYMAVKLSHLTRGGEKWLAHLFKDGSMEALLCADLSQELADMAGWSLCALHSVSVNPHGQQKTDRLSGGWCWRRAVLIDWEQTRNPSGWLTHIKTGPATPGVQNTE